MKRLLDCFAVVAMLVRGVGLAHADCVDTTLDFPSAAATSVCGIKETGQVVGGFRSGSPTGSTHGLLLSGGAYTHLDVPGSVSGSFAYGISDSGQIPGLC